MDVPVVNASNVSQPRTWGVVNVLKGAGTAAITGACIGFIGAFLLIFLPYNRIVAVSQPLSTVVQVRSLKFSQGGFVGVYLINAVGSTLIGHSAYMSPGYYRNISVPIAYQNVQPDTEIDNFQESYHLYVVLFMDNGDRMFNELQDTRVTSPLDQRNFWMLFGNTTVRDAASSFSVSPLKFFTSIVFP